MTIQFNNVMQDKTDYFNTDEIIKMFDYLISAGRYRDYMLLETLYKTQRRISEIVGTPPYINNPGFRPLDIHPDKPLIEFSILKKNPVKSKTKDGKQRSQEILKKLRFDKKPKRALKAVPEEFYKAIKLYIEKLGIPQEMRVFPITRQRADQIIKDVSKVCNIQRPRKGIHLHQFRHSFSIHYLEMNDKDPSALLKLSGMLDHSSLEITKGYAQFTQQDIIDSLNKTFENRGYKKPTYN